MPPAPAACRLTTKKGFLAFRVSPDLKSEIQGIADNEARSISQVCELLLSEGSRPTRRKDPSLYSAWSPSRKPRAKTHDLRCHRLIAATTATRNRMLRVRAMVAPRARYCALGQCVMPQRSEMDLCSVGSHEITMTSSCCTQGKYLLPEWFPE